MTECKSGRECKREGSIELHLCPYKQEIDEDYESWCNCCDVCTHDCAMDV